MLSKKKRGVDWQKESHGLVKQKRQSSMSAASQSSGKYGSGEKTVLYLSVLNMLLSNVC